MPVSLFALMRNTASVTIPIGENTLTIIYYPRQITDENIALIDSGSDGRNQALASIIKSWDFYEDEEQTITVPITPERLEGIDIGIKAQIAFALIRDMRPNLAAPR